MGQLAGALGGLAAGRLRRGQVGKQVEDILKVAENGVVDGKLSIENLLEVGADVAEAEVESLEGLKLVGDACGKGADGNVADIS